MNRQDPGFSPMTHRQRIEALQRVGHTRREAAFLSLAALHSGYFIRRQFNQFVDKKHGSIVMRLIGKTERNRHTRRTIYLGQTHVYHLYSRAFYRIIGDSENRNRRRRSPPQIKTKLMCLDFLLANRLYTYLATEWEKVNYFTSRGISQSALPRKIYHSNRGHRQTTRYFIEKLPIFLAHKNPPVVSFCYIEADAQSIAGFRSFLAKYTRLFSQLRRFQVVYVAETERHFRSAENQFSKLVQSLRDGQVDPFTISLLEFFRLENLYQKKEFSQLDKDELIRLRKARKQFQGPDVHALFELFQRASERAVIETLAPRRSSCVPVEATFSPYRLDHHYDFLGRWRHSRQW